MCVKQNSSCLPDFFFAPHIMLYTGTYIFILHAVPYSWNNEHMMNGASVVYHHIHLS